MRGGSTITFNELENSILIKDPSGNTWFMDGAGNISVKAPNTFSVEATDIIMTALKNVSVTAGASITETAGIDHSISAGAMMSQMAGADYSLMAANIMEVAQGERKSKAKEVKEVSKNRQVQSEESNDFHSSKDI
jgi:type VI secretion system secreted protein VgrG